MGCSSFHDLSFLDVPSRREPQGEEWLLFCWFFPGVAEGDPSRPPPREWQAGPMGSSPPASGALKTHRLACEVQAGLCHLFLAQWMELLLNWISQINIANEFVEFK